MGLRPPRWREGVANSVGNSEPGSVTVPGSFAAAVTFAFSVGLVPSGLRVVVASGAVPVADHRRRRAVAAGVIVVGFYPLAELLTVLNIAFARIPHLAGLCRDLGAKH